MKKWTIYKIDSPSGKTYIGKTSNFKKRMAYYRIYGCVGQTRLFSSLKKHGFDNHIISVLDEFQSDSDFANDKEMFWIRSFMINYCKWPENDGLNLTDGGEGNAGYKASEETKNKLRESHIGKPSPRKGIKMTQEQRDNMKAKGRITRPLKPKKIPPTKEETRIRRSLAKKGKPAHNKGKPMPKHQLELLRSINTGRPCKFKGKQRWTEEERKKMGEANIGNTYNKGRKQRPEVVAARVLAMTGKPNPKNNKPIIYEDLLTNKTIEYSSLKEANKELGISLWAIGDSLAGRFKLPKPYIFKYKNQ